MSFLGETESVGLAGDRKNGDIVEKYIVLSQEVTWPPGFAPPAWTGSSRLGSSLAVLYSQFPSQKRLDFAQNSVTKQESFRSNDREELSCSSIGD